MSAYRHSHLGLQGLAYAGVVVGYVPLLTLLLPLKLSEMVPADGQVGWLSLCAIGGAVSASLGGVLGGWASDRTRDGRLGRRGWMAVGLVGFLLSFLMIARSAGPVSLLAAIVAFQFALNLILGPLMAAFAEETPDERRGLLGGVLALVYPAGALVGVAATFAPVQAFGAELLLVALATSVMVLPFILSRPPVTATATSPSALSDTAKRRIADFGRAGVARFLVQVAGGVVFAFLLYYLAGLPDAGPSKDIVAARVAAVAAVVTAASAPVGLAIGWTTDRRGGWRPWLAGAASVCALGLTIMAFAAGWPAAVAGYALFGAALAVFLALHASYAMKLLPSPRHRGRDLGLMNLSNTLPAMLGPGLTWAVLSFADYRTLLLLLAGFSAAAALLMLSIGRPSPN